MSDVIIADVFLRLETQALTESIDRIIRDALEEANLIASDLALIASSPQGGGDV